MKTLTLWCVIACGTLAFAKLDNDDAHAPYADILWQFETGG